MIKCDSDPEKSRTRNETYTTAKQKKNENEILIGPFGTRRENPRQKSLFKVIETFPKVTSVKINNIYIHTYTQQQ